MTSLYKNTFLSVLGLVLLHAVTAQIDGTAGSIEIVRNLTTENNPAETVNPAVNGDVAGTPTSIDANAPDSLSGGSPTSLDTVAVAEVTTQTPVIPVATTQAAVPVATSDVGGGPPQSPDQIVGGAINTVVSTPSTVVQPSQPSQGAPIASDIPTTANSNADVTATVLALLNETGYSGNANDANVQEIVKMLMNGTVPTDADLIRLGIIPPPVEVTTMPPPYTIPGAATGGAGSPTVNFPTNQQPPLTNTGTFPTGTGTSDPLGGFTGSGPVLDLNLGGGAPTSGGAPSTGGVPTTGGGVPTTGVGIPTTGMEMPTTGGGMPTTGGGMPTTGGGMPTTGGGTPTTGGIPFPNNVPATGGFPMPNTGMPTNPMIPTGTNPLNPLQGDPFNLNPNTGLPPTDPNAVGPKPLPGPLGGTPGSPNDLLNALNAGNTGTGGMAPSPTGGILDQAYGNAGRGNSVQRRGGGGMFSNPLLMMMLLSPEGMEGMMGGENPMMTMMLLNQLMPRRRPQPSGLQAGGMRPNGFSTMPAMGMSPTMMGQGASNLPLPGIGSVSPVTGGTPGQPSMMDMLSSLTNVSPGSLTGGPTSGMPTGTGTGPTGLDLMAPASPTGPTGLDLMAPASPTGPSPLDLLAGGSPTGPTALTMNGGAPPTGGNDMMSLMNMINSQPAAGGAGGLMPLAG